MIINWREPSYAAMLAMVNFPMGMELVCLVLSLFQAVSLALCRMELLGVSCVTLEKTMPHQEPPAALGTISNTLMGVETASPVLKPALAA